MKHIIIYTDGACRGNNSKIANLGAWAYYLIFKDGDKVVKEQINCQAVENTTNNQMELIACIESLEALNEKADSYPIDVYSDSQYLIRGMNEWLPGWVAKNFNGVKNPYLWQRLKKLKDRLPHVKYHWVRGHDKNAGNLEVDKLCNECMDAYIQFGKNVKIR